MKYPEALELLQQLISIPSVSEDIVSVNRATDTMKAFLDSHGLHTVLEEFDGRKVLFASKQPGKRHALLFNAHLDVVPPSEDGQFTPVIRNNGIIGRGAADDKGSATAIAQALINAAPDADVAAFFTADEEIGGSTTRAMIDAGYAPTQIAVISDTEQSGEISVSQKGILIARLVAHGQGGHASTPWCFDNPILKLAHALDSLAKAWQNPTAEDQWRNSMAPCILKGGSVMNQIPDEAEAILNIRYVKSGDEEKILAFLKEHSGLDDVQFIGEHCLPLDCEPNHPLVQRLKDCVQKHLPDKPVVYVKMNGATDARHLAHLNLPIAVIGIKGRGLHGKDEAMCLTAYEQTIDILTDFANTFRLV